MTDHDLDLSYTALAQALADIGADRAPLLLATLALSLVARQPDAKAVLPLIEQALRLART